MIENQKLKWVVYLAVGVLFYLFFIKSTEGFGSYPCVYQDYKMDDWHCYWQKRQAGSEKRLSGLPSYKSPAEASYKLSSDRDYYPLPIPVAGQYKTILHNEMNKAIKE